MFLKGNVKLLNLVPGMKCGIGLWPIPCLTLILYALLTEVQHKVFEVQ